MEDASLGPAFSDAEVKSFLDSNRVSYTRFKDDRDPGWQNSEDGARKHGYRLVPGTHEMGPEGAQEQEHPCKPRKPAGKGASQREAKEYWIENLAVVSGSIIRPSYEIRVADSN